MRTITARACKRALAGVALVAAVSVAATPAMSRETLTLRVNDGFAEPGGLAAVVVRTYATKPISQGQLCFRAARVGSRAGGVAVARAQSADGDVFTSLEGVKVFAKKKDALSVASLEGDAEGQTIIVEFSSDSGSINRSDGPLAVIYFRVSSDVSPGDKYRIEIDLANTLVFDDRGEAISLEPRAGRLRIRHPAEPYEAEAEGDRIAPGEKAIVGVETYEPVAMASGQIGFLYEPAIVDGRVKVKMRRRHGKRKFSVDRSIPGLLVVNFRSPDNSWNMVPGEILTVKLPTSSRVPIGTRSRVALDRSLTFFVGPSGEMLPYVYEKGSIRFRNEDGDDDDD